MMAEGIFEHEKDLKYVSLISYGTRPTAEGGVLMNVEVGASPFDKTKTVMVHIAMSPRQALRLAGDLSVIAKAMMPAPSSPLKR
jgi:hypothetical protein